MPRFYIPYSLDGLGELVGTERALRELGDDDELGVEASVGHAVTDELRQAFPDLDAESLEHYAMTEAAQESLHQVSSDGGWTRRLVLAAEVDAVVGRPGEMTLADADAVVLRDVVAYMVDTDDAVEDVAAAAVAIRTGADGADALVQRCLDHELGWYATTEVDEVIRLT